MVTFPVLFINLFSILMMMVAMVVIWHIREKNGGLQLFGASLFMLFWAVGSFAEMVSQGLGMKILWRNLTQIGVFYTPIASLLFSVVYTGIGNSFRKPLAWISYSVQSLGILLVMTDRWHHFMRKSITLIRTPLYETLVVDTTILGKCLISINFLCMVLSLGLLTIYAFTATPSSRKQVLSVLFGMVIGVVYSLAKVVSNEQFVQLVPISGVFALSAFFMLLGIFRYDLLRIAPLAREQVFHFLGEGLVIASSEGVLVEANRTALTMFGPTLQYLEQLIRVEISQWHEALLGKKETNFAFYHHQSYFHCNLYTIKNKRGTVLGTISLVKDCTEQKQRDDLLFYRAQRDGLTGLYNRQTFIEKVERRLQDAHDPVCLYYLDIDHFKQINDLYGHRGGDQLLASLSNCIKRLLGPADLSGRMGGEEFAIFRSSGNLEENLQWAEMLRKSIEDAICLFEGKAISCTISLGLCASSPVDFDVLYRMADEQVYRAKKAGKNCICSIVHD